MAPYREMSSLIPLHDIYEAIDQRVFAIVSTEPEWPCRKGCDACCRRLAQPPQVTAAEWAVLQQGLAQLAPPVQAAIAERLRTLSPTAGPAICPLLDERTGACHVYAHRPAACRMYGFYVSRDGNQWCGDIQTRHEAGMGDGVVLGNYQAIQRELNDRFGEAQSIVTWFEQTQAED